MDEHDTIYKLLFAHDRMIQDLLVGFLPDKWVAALDLESLEKMNGSYVTDDLRGRHGDAVWRIRWGEEWLYVYLLLEFHFLHVAAPWKTPAFIFIGQASGAFKLPMAPCLAEAAN